MRGLRQNKGKNVYGVLDYLVVFWILAISGNPLVSESTEYLYIISAFLLLLLMAFKRPQIWQGTGWLAFALVVLFVLQYVFLDKVSIKADINYIAKLACAFMAASLLGERFRYAYMKVMTFVCAVSLLGYAANLVVGVFPGIRTDRYVSIFLYNFIPSSIYSGTGVRNCGMFWEPGAFQGYIMLALMMYLYEFRDFYNNNKTSFWILVIALLTTRSTTGYVVFMAYLAGVLVSQTKKAPLTLFLFALLVAGGLWAFGHFDFLGEKISLEYENAVEMDAGDVSWTRMGSAMIAWNNVLRHPLIGNGFLLDSMYGSLGQYMTGSGNGFFGAMNVLGIPFFLLYLLLLYKNYPARSWLPRLWFVFLVSMLLNGEFFLNFPMFWALIFIRYPDNEKNCCTPHCA